VAFTAGMETIELAKEELGRLYDIDYVDEDVEFPRGYHSSTIDRLDTVVPSPASPNIVEALDDVEWIGFDMDHTLAAYDLSNFCPLVHKLVTNYLVNKWNYPQTLKLTSFNATFGGRGLVYDTRNGNMLKLDAGGDVIIAYHGHRRMTIEETLNTYPMPLTDIENQPHAFIAHTFFESSVFYLISLLVPYIDDGSLVITVNEQKTKETYASIMTRLYAAFDYMYGDFHTGPFFLELRNSTSLYIQQRPDVQSWLTRGEHGFFLVTNSPYEYTALVCTFIFGPTWRDLFVYVMVKAQKPRFFTQHSPFLDVHTKMPYSIDTVLEPGVYEGGNAHQLTFSLRSRIPGKIMYAEDHIKSGAMAVKSHTDWKVLMIVDEMHSTTVCKLFGTPFLGGYWESKLEKISDLMLGSLSEMTTVSL
jgi:5'-nucleotidase